MIVVASDARIGFVAPLGRGGPPVGEESGGGSGGGMVPDSSVVLLRAARARVRDRANSSCAACGAAHKLRE